MDDNPPPVSWSVESATDVKILLFEVRLGSYFLSDSSRISKSKFLVLLEEVQNAKCLILKFFFPTGIQYSSFFHRALVKDHA